MQRPLLPFVTTLLFAAPASAGGYDTPMLYTAEHMGGGGAAVAWVDDPSALFHNPAGLARTERFSGLLDVSYLSGWIKGSPNGTPDATSIKSEPTSAPFFMVGAAGAISPKVRVGFAFYPIASAGGSYRYKLVGNQVTDSTRLVFLEATPGLALQLPGRLNLGLGYRFTLMTLTRLTQPEGQLPTTNFELAGQEATGLRAGLQWTAIEERNGPVGLDLGLSYRHRVIVPVTAENGTAVAMNFKDIESTFTLPSRLIAGLSAHKSGYRFNLDVEHGFNSQNQSSELRGMQVLNGEDQSELGVKNVFAWKDAQTLRVGFEALERFKGHQVLARLGYAHDGTTSSKVYPTAFGTPPGPTQIFTLGLGFRPKNMKIDIAYAHRTGEATVTQEDVTQRTEVCLFCSHPGDYEIALNGFYTSFVYQLP
ncbi:MAG: hypothetical protein CMH55_06805 [Myxococcales bacterium]|nr:hypothetical protein [Myxococcales bacterium]